MSQIKFINLQKIIVSKDKIKLCRLVILIRLLEIAKYNNIETITDRDLVKIISTFKIFVKNLLPGPVFFGYFQSFWWYNSELSMMVYFFHKFLRIIINLYSWNYKYKDLKEQFRDESNEEKSKKILGSVEFLVEDQKVTQKDLQFGLAKQNSELRDFNKKLNQQNKNFE